MKMLMEIDTVKTRMQDASRALKVFKLNMYQIQHLLCPLERVIILLYSHWQSGSLNHLLSVSWRVHSYLSGGLWSRNYWRFAECAAPFNRPSLECFSTETKTKVITTAVAVVIQSVNLTFKKPVRT